MGNTFSAVGEEANIVRKLEFLDKVFLVRGAIQVESFRRFKWNWQCRFIW